MSPWMSVSLRFAELSGECPTVLLPCSKQGLHKITREFCMRLLQRVSIACYTERCTSYSKSVCLSVRLSVTRWYCVKETYSLSTLSQKSATICRRKVRLAHKWDCRRKVRTSPNFAVVSPFSATVSLLCDSLTFLRQVHRALRDNTKTGERGRPII